MCRVTVRTEDLGNSTSTVHFLPRPFGNDVMEYERSRHGHLKSIHGVTYGPWRGLRLVMASVSLVYFQCGAGLIVHQSPMRETPTTSLIERVLGVNLSIPYHQWSIKSH